MSAPAQSPTVKCPSITVECPTNILQQGDPFIVTSEIVGYDPNLNPTYNWSISAGIITSGQGTPSITIDTTGTVGQTITATLEVGGLDSTCANSASCSYVACPAPVSRRFDKFGDLAFADEKKRLDYFAEQLEKEQGSMASIIVYGKQGARTPEAQARADRAKEYLVNKRAVSAERITTIDGGLRPRLQVELWITPQGGALPQPEEQEQ
ncbi:MAG TPA: hypothetical protein VM911_15695 [Pyrinomonadaceae bacterium]|jgi:hypothetical protein|nr:hypothetical protein [Pyrinomonadaceae bacterium]